MQTLVIVQKIMESVSFQTSPPSATEAATTITRKTKKEKPMVEVCDPSTKAVASSLMVFLQNLDFDNLASFSLVDDNARMHRTESYFRIELTSTAAPESETRAWCPTDPVVGSARTTKDRWGVHKKVAMADEMKLEEEESSSEFFIKKPNRRSSIDSYDFFESYQQSPVSRSDSVLPSTSSMTTPQQTTTTPSKTWDSLLRRSDSVRRTSLPFDSVLRQPQRGLSPNPMVMPPAPPARALSPPPRSSVRRDHPSTWKMLNAATSVASFDECFEFDEDDDVDDESDYELPLPKDGEHLSSLTPIQSPVAADNNITRSGGTTTSCSSSGSSFQRQPPTHTNSFEVTHRRSARRSSVKRRFVKMTQQDLQSRILDILLLDDEDNDSTSNDDDHYSTTTESETED